MIVAISKVRCFHLLWSTKANIVPKVDFVGTEYIYSLCFVVNFDCVPKISILLVVTRYTISASYSLLYTRTVRSITVRSRREFSFIRVKAIVDHGCKPGRMGLIDQDASNSKRKVKSPLQYSLRWSYNRRACATSVITQPTDTGVKANATVTNQIIPHSTLRRSTCMNN